MDNYQEYMNQYDPKKHTFSQIYGYVTEKIINSSKGKKLDNLDLESKKSLLRDAIPGIIQEKRQLDKEAKEIYKKIQDLFDTIPEEYGWNIHPDTISKFEKISETMNDWANIWDNIREYIPPYRHGTPGAFEDEIKELYTEIKKRRELIKRISLLDKKLKLIDQFIKLNFSKEDIEREEEQTKKINKTINDKQDRKKRQSKPLGEGKLGKDATGFLLGSNENVEPSTPETKVELSSIPDETPSVIDSDSSSVQSVPISENAIPKPPELDPQQTQSPQAPQAQPTQTPERKYTRLPDRGRWQSREYARAYAAGIDPYSDEFQEELERKWKKIEEEVEKQNASTPEPTSPEAISKILGDTRVEGEDLETPSAPQASEIPATPKAPMGTGAEGEDLETPSAEIPATPKAPMGTGAEGEDVGTPSAPQAPEIPATPKAPMGAGVEREDVGTPSAPQAPEIPATPKTTNQGNIQDYDGQFPLMDEWERIHREEAENAGGDYQVGKGVEGEHLETPAAPKAPEIPATPKALMGTGAEEEDSGTPSAPKAPEIPATPKTTNQAEPKGIAEPKQTSYDEGKVREYIESIANESNRDLRKRIKEENKNKSGLSEDIAQEEAEFRRQIAQEYLKTKDPQKKAQLEQTFIGKIPGVSAKDHARHILDLQEGKKEQDKTEISDSASVTPQPSIATETPKQTEVAQAKIPESSANVEPKTPESSLTSTPSELTASSLKSGSELNAVRETAVEDRMLSQQSQQPIIMPISMGSGGARQQMVGGSDSPSDAMIPMAIVNDEEIIRMNSFEVNKYRMI